VRLTVSGKPETASLTVRMDPRVKMSVSDLQKQFESESDLSSAIDQSSAAMMQAQSVHEQIEKIDRHNPQLQDSIEQLDGKISGIVGGDKEKQSDSPQQSLGEVNTNLLALYRAIGQADAAPTQAQIELIAETKKLLIPLVNRWNEVKSTAIPALNQKLTSAGLPQLRLDLPPQNEAGGENEE
jgi:chromosome segregation ATPase